MKRKSANMHANAVQSKVLRVYVNKDDIESAECRMPTKCMIKVAVKRALNLAHGYIHVDATGVSISRNGSYREKAFLPQKALLSMIAFDKKMPVRPFSFQLKFHKTTKVTKYSVEQRDKKVIAAKKSGIANKKYNMRSRVIGISVSGGGQIAAGG